MWTGWLTDDDVLELWPDAPSSELMLELLNEAAITGCTEFAASIDSYALLPSDTLHPNETLIVPEPPKTVPANFKLAQLMQIRNLWNASKVDAGGSMGEGDFSTTPFPLDWQVKALLRPKRARPVIG